MYIHEERIRVCYADTDQMGYVYYGNYARYYEIGRVESLRSLGFSYKKLEDSGVMLPVYEHSSRYHQPAKYDDLLTVKVLIKTMPTVRILFSYEIYNEEGTLLNTGETTLVFIDKHSNKITKAPADLVQKLRPYLQ
ncbi:thioesterase family protein [Cytophagaceae bacterium DM2B3-1]|uniref:Thioesterase family protein n=1 Tax=Xanthocytophaga flava TaxID=3048013 RepID=A0ABT7CGT3_9BACT|nr:thioesterase family protein [Xanthocytophaga flavus]MDJ1491919.1 thioesterase family protein [Xanthocytophaga flavus]